MEKPKTSAEWEKIKFRNSIDPRSGGYSHDAATLLAAGIEPTEENKTKLEKWIKFCWEVNDKIKQDIIMNQLESTETQEKREEEGNRIEVSKEQEIIRGYN